MIVKIKIKSLIQQKKRHLVISHNDSELNICWLSLSTSIVQRREQEITDIYLSLQFIYYSIDYLYTIERKSQQNVDHSPQIRILFCKNKTKHFWENQELKLRVIKNKQEIKRWDFIASLKTENFKIQRSWKFHTAKLTEFSQFDFLPNDM